MMKTTFESDGIGYVLEYTEKHEILFYVDVLASDRIAYQMSEFERRFGDSPPDTIWTKTRRLDGVRNVFAIKRHIEDFIDQAILLRQRSGQELALSASG